MGVESLLSLLRIRAVFWLKTVFFFFLYLFLFGWFLSLPVSVLLITRVDEDFSFLQTLGQMCLWMTKPISLCHSQSTVDPKML